MLDYINPKAKKPDQVAILTRGGCGYCAKAKALLKELGYASRSEARPQRPLARGRRHHRARHRAADLHQRPHIGGLEDLQRWRKAAWFVRRFIIGDELLVGKRRQASSFLIGALAKRGLHRLGPVPGGRSGAADRGAAAIFSSSDVVFSFGGIGARRPTIAPLVPRRSASNLSSTPRPRKIRAALAPVTPQRLQMGEFPVGSSIIPNPVTVLRASVREHHFVPGFPQMAWPMVEWVLDRATARASTRSGGKRRRSWFTRRARASSSPQCKRWRRRSRASRPSACLRWAIPAAASMWSSVRGAPAEWSRQWTNCVRWCAQRIPYK